MKKTIAILLVAVLALSSVFAGFSLSGEANVSLKGDIDGKTLGFKNGDNKVKVTIEGATDGCYLSMQKNRKIVV